MSKSAGKVLILAVGVIVAVTLFLGCEEKNLSDTESSTTKSRFIANENRQLKEKIRELERRHKRQIKRREELLAKCRKEKKAIEEMSAEDVKGLLDSALKKVPEDIARLNEENQNLKWRIEELRTENGYLKSQIARLKKELEELRKKLTTSDKPESSL